MRRALPLAAALLSAAAQAAEPAKLRAEYAAYLGPLDFLAIEARMRMDPGAYHLDVKYRTVGPLRVLYPGQQHSAAAGALPRDRPRPERFHGLGVWRGKDYATLIDYPGGSPELRDLRPAADEERESVPPEARAGAIDTLSALAGLIDRVARDGACDGDERLYDGRRASRARARSAGTEVLARSARGAYAGPALRCDFEASVIAGHRKSDDAEARAKPFRGSAWFAPMPPSPFPVPVRIEFETRSLGFAKLYLTTLAAD